MAGIVGHGLEQLGGGSEFGGLVEKYGREYDLDIYNIVAVDSFNMGAMENKGAVVR